MRYAPKHCYYKATYELRRVEKSEKGLIQLNCAPVNNNSSTSSRSVRPGYYQGVLVSFHLRAPLSAAVLYYIYIVEKAAPVAAVVVHINHRDTTPSFRS